MMQALAASAPAHAHDAHDAGPAQADDIAEIALCLRPGKRAPEAVRGFLEGAGLAVRHEPAKRRLYTRATLGQLSRVLQTPIHRFTHPAGTYRSHTNAVQLPEELHSLVEAVLGLDDRPQLRRKLARAPRPFTEAAGGVAGFSPVEIASLYDFPAALDGSGECIGIIALGGGYVQSDLDAYFGGIGLATPHITLETVDGAQNSPGHDPACDAEVLFDLEIAGSVAPKASFVVYLAPDTDRGFLDALEAAVHDSVNRPSVISISLGQPECTWSKQVVTAFEQLLYQASLAGITVCCAAGDAGSGAGVTDGRAHVEYPASSPWVLACGGTSLRAEASTIASERVWNELQVHKGATGGGISDLFGPQTWQSAVAIPASVNPGARIGRGVPDVAADADQATGYRLRLGGRSIVAGGTSAAAPLWAGLCARINQHTGRRMGFINPLIYRPAIASVALRAITQGSNGAYAASAAAWNACTGLGTPRGAALLAALAATK